MFNLFKKKTEAEKLDAQYKKLLKESFELSTSNRRLSDEKAAAANEILKQMNKNNEMLT